MKLGLTDTILLALMVAVLMVGGHQTYVIAQQEGFKVGFLKSYWIFMFLIILIVIYQSRKNKSNTEKREASGKALKENGNKHKKKIRHKKQR